MLCGSSLHVERDLCNYWTAKLGFKESPKKEVQGDYVVERSVVEKKIGKLEIQLLCKKSFYLQGD